ncbi:MAG: hypothetical protein ACOX9E_09640 [Lentisphaeria bacterium]
MDRLFRLPLVVFLFLAAFIGIAQEVAKKTPPEKNIYLPYERLWEIFEKDQRGVFLPYAEFQQLWQRAYGQPDPEKPKPPAPALITAIRGDMTVLEHNVRSSVTLSIDLYERGWLLMPLALPGCAVTHAAIGDDAARLIHESQSGYTLLYHKESAERESITLSLDFISDIQKQPGINSLQFQPPASPISTWELLIPEADAKVTADQERMIMEKVPAEAGQSRFRLHLSGGAKRTISWTPKAEGAKGLEALINTSAELINSIEDGMLFTQALIRCRISRVSVRQLALAIPAAFRVTSVFDPNIREWNLSADEVGQRLDIQLYEPVTDEQNVSLEMERTLADGQIDIPAIALPGAVRQQGHIAIRLGDGLKAELSERRGLTQAAPAAMPPGMAGKGPFFACYQYAALPWQLRYHVQALKPLISSETSSTAVVMPNTLQLLSEFRVKVRQTGIFHLDLDIPDGFEVAPCQGLAGVQISDQHLGDAVAGRRPLRVNFRQKSTEPVIRLTLRRELSEPALLLHGQKPAELSIAVPRLGGENIDQENGRLSVSAPPHLRIVPLRSENLRSIDVSGDTPAPIAPNDSPSQRALPVLAYGYSAPAAQPLLVLAADRRPPHSTVTQLISLSVLSGNQLNVECVLNVDVQYSGIKALQLGVPKELLPRLQILPASFRLSPLAETTEEYPEGYQACSIQGEAEFYEKRSVTLRWTDDLGDIPVGSSRDLQLPCLIVSAVNRSWGQIVFMKNDMTDLSPLKAEKLLPIDPRFNLLPELAGKSAQVARAFEFHSPWQLQARITRYQHEKVKSSSIERGLIRMVHTRSNNLSVQAAYAMRSVRQRLELQLPPEVVFDSTPARINDRPVPLEKGGEGQYFIPLTGQAQGEPLLLELRYLLPESRGIFMLPQFPDDTAIQQLYLMVYLPKELSIMDCKGPWNNENVWALQGVMSVRPRPRRHANELISWLCAGQRQFEACRESLQSFVTDGQPVLYSTLHPPAGPNGALHLLLWPTWLGKALFIAIIIAVGLLLLKASLFKRALTVGFMLSAMGFLAVFAPSFCYGIVSNASVVAALTVAIIWFLAWLRRRPQRPAGESSDLPPGAGKFLLVLAGILLVFALCIHIPMLIPVVLIIALPLCIVGWRRRRRQAAENAERNVNPPNPPSPPLA